MKLLLIFILVFPIYLASSQKDLKIDNRDIYNQGIQDYKNKNFKNSYNLFSKIYLQKLMDSKFNFYYGRSAYETGNYEIALAAFERVEMIDSTNLRVKLEIGRVYFMLKMYEDAKLQFQEVLQNQALPPNVRTNVELYLAKISGAEKKSFTYTTVTLDFFHDSNINYGSLDDQYNISGMTLPTQDELPGSGFQISGDIINIYDIGDKNGYSIKNRVSMFMKHHTDSDNSIYDIGYLAYNPSLLYRTAKYTAELELGIDTLSVGSKTYLQSISLKPKFDFNHTPTLKSLVYFKYIDKMFKQDSQKDLDANHYELSYGLQKILTPRSYVQANIIGITEDKKQGNRIDVDFTEYKFNINYANQFTSTYSIELYAEAKEKKYDNYSTLFSSTRRDTSITSSITCGAKVLPTLTFKLKALYNRVNSNQTVFSYDKNVITASIVKTF